MRIYPRNSPEAAARIVALAVLADGRFGSEEMLMLDFLRAHDQLGLSVRQLDAVLEAFCEDLGGTHTGWPEAGLIDPRTMEELMAVIDDPAMRRQILQLCVVVVEADGRICDSESIVLNAMVEHWGLHRSMFELQPVAGLIQPASQQPL